jgi:glycosyltransferase involved in cell wall biosynthesis
MLPAGPVPGRKFVKRRVALNGRYSGVARPTGAQTVAHDLFGHLVAADRDFDLVIFADRNGRDVSSWVDRPGVEVVHVPFRSWGRMRSQLYEQTRLARDARARGASLVYHPINTCPRFAGGIRHVVTLLDLNFHHNPQWYGRSFRTWLELTTIPGLKKADRVACISDWVADDARRTLGLDPARVRRIYCGLRQLGHVENPPTDPDVVLAVNPFQPHKNLPRLIDAVGRLRQENPRLRLRIAGRPQDNFQPDPHLADRLRRDYVHVTGYLTDEQLGDEYARAAVLCIPSFEEGFGMPIIEAMAHDTTVVASNASCLPEIAGEAGILVDPSSIEAIAEGLRQALAEGPEDRARRHELGRAHARAFDWSEIARQYVALFREVLDA